MGAPFEIAFRPELSSVRLPRQLACRARGAEDDDNAPLALMLMSHEVTSC
jgi:hypothetical protein